MIQTCCQTQRRSCAAAWQSVTGEKRYIQRGLTVMECLSVSEGSFYNNKHSSNESTSSINRISLPLFVMSITLLLRDKIAPFRGVGVAAVQSWGKGGKVER